MAKLCLHQLALYEQGIILPQMSEYHFIGGVNYVQNTMVQPGQRLVQQSGTANNFGKHLKIVFFFNFKFVNRSLFNDDFGICLISKLDEEKRATLNYKLKKKKNDKKLISKLKTC